MKINSILSKIKESKNIAITFHESPDGDSIGSAIALMIALRKIGKNVKIISKDAVPNNLSFLPFSNEINGEVTKIPEDVECVIVVDCGDVKRINAENLDLNNKKYILINIDHHLSNEMYGDYNYVKTNVIAVAEIIYEIIKNMNIEINKEIATSLYTSIITDSGSFKHSGTTASTHIIAGNLINTGIDFAEIHRKVFENKPLNKVKLYGKIIENMKLILDGKLCLIKVKKNMLEPLNIKMDDIGDVISIGTQIDTVEVTAMLKESDIGTKVSLRSKNIVDVRKIAENYNGGGHMRAAGLVMDLPIDKTEEIIIDAIKKELV